MKGYLIFRFLVIFSILNLINLFAYNGGAGMEPVWILIIIASSALSLKKIYKYIFSILWFKTLFILICSLFIIVEMLIIVNGFKTDIDYKADYIVILGARVKGETPSLALKYRLDKGYEYLMKHPDSKAVLSGGKGSGEYITEAEAMRRYLLNKGIDETRLIIEDKSKSTVENIKNSFALIDNENKDGKVVIITSRFHVFRSKIIAKKNGKIVEGIGVKTMEFLIPNYYLREFFAVIKDLVF